MIYKLFQTSPARYALYSNTYMHTLEHIMSLFNEASNDFPDLQYEQVDILIYGEGIIKGHMGIEFSMPKSEEIHPDYKQVQRLAYKLT